MNIWYASVIGQCGEVSLVLRFDTVPEQNIFDFLQTVGRKSITYDNSFPGKKRSFLSIEDNNKYYVCVKPVLSRSQKLEESLKSKVVNNFF